MKEAIYIYVLLLGLGTVFAQDAKTIITKAQQCYNKDTYSLEMKYHSYATYTTNEVFTSYDAVLIKKETDVYYKISNTEMILVGTDMLKIAHDQKLVQHNQVNQASASQMNPMDIEKLLPYFVKKEVKETDTTYQCTFYTSEITQLPYSRLEVFVNKNTYEIQKQIMYFNQVKKYKIANGEIKSNYPRMEIICHPMGTDIDNEKFVLSNYIHKKGSTVTLHKKYSNYKLVD